MVKAARKKPAKSKSRKTAKEAAAMSVPPRRTNHARIQGLQMIAAALEAAQSRDDLWQLADFKDADATLNPVVRRAIRARARYEAANNPLVARVVETWTTDIVREDGPTLQVDSGDPTLDSEIEAAWSEWWCDNNVADDLRTAVRAEAVDGEAVAVIRFTDSGPVVVPMEADRLGSPYWTATNKSTDIDGVHLDPVTQRPIGYEVLKAHPGTGYIDKISAIAETDRYPAAMVLHAFRRTRPEQHRGCCRFTPALVVSGHGRKYMEASVVREQLRAAFWVMFKSQAMAGGDDEETGEDDWWQEIKLPGKSGIGSILPEGLDPVSLPRDTANSETEQMQQIVAGQVAGCFTQPLSRAIGKDTGGGYSGNRAQMEPYHATIQAERSMTWDSQWLRKLYRIFLMWYQATHPVRKAANGREVPIDWTAVRPERCEFIWPQKELIVDPSRETAAEVTKLAIGKTTCEEVAGTNDLDARDERAAKAFNMTRDQLREARARVVFGAPPVEPRPDSDPEVATNGKSAEMR